MMEVRAHDAEGEVALHVLKERVASEAASKGLLPRDQERASEERADRRAGDSDPPGWRIVFGNLIRGKESSAAGSVSRTNAMSSRESDPRARAHSATTQSLSKFTSMAERLGIPLRASTQPCVVFPALLRTSSQSLAFSMLAWPILNRRSNALPLAAAD